MLDAFSTIAEGLDHPEGVAWDPDGRVYAGGEAGQLYAVTLRGDVEQIASTGGFIYGVALDGEGNVYACDFGRTEVVRVSPSGRVESYSKGTPERPMRVPNFPAFDGTGNLYVTDSGEWGADDGLIYRVEPGGRTVLWTEAVPRYPNGCCMSLGGDALLVIESRGRTISSIPILDDGTAGPPGQLADLTGSLPDGMALAADGTMFVGCYRPDRIYRIPPGGIPQVWADDPDGVVLNQPTNLAFAGPNSDRIVVASLGGWSLAIAEADVIGAPLHYPRIT